jgi:oligopeptide transport system substrate-binding protein
MGLAQAQGGVVARVIPSATRDHLKGFLVALLLGMTLPAQAETVLRRGNSVEPETLDPHRARGVSASNVLRDLYEGLTTESPAGAIVPGVAERWEASPDGRHYTFHLRADARWSSGEPVTAADFVESWRRLRAPATASPVGQWLDGVEEAQAVDARTLRLQLRAATPQLPALLSHPASYPVHASNRAGGAFAPGTLVGNGAFRLASWTAHAHITLERNEHYHGRAGVALERVRYFPTESPGSELKRYRAGELDWTDTIPVSQARWIREHLGRELHVSSYLGTYFYGFNLTRPPFKDNPGLRRALALAVDRETLAARILGTGESAAYGWVPPGIAGYTPQQPEWAAWPADRRLAEARRLYAQAGYSPERPLEVELRYNTGDNHKRVALAVAWMWRQALGVRVRLLNEEYKVFLQNRRSRLHTQLFRADWIGDYDDAATFAGRMHSGSGLNDTGYASAAYDALVDEAAAEPDAARRRALLEQAERVLLEDLPVLPLYFYVSKHLVKPTVTGWQPNIMDHHYSRYFRIQ